MREHYINRDIDMHIRMRVLIHAGGACSLSTHAVGQQGSEREIADDRSGIKPEEAHAYLCRQSIREVSERVAVICPPL